MVAAGAEGRTRCAPTPAGARPAAKPQLLATRPNQVWSWDITKLLGPVKWTYFYLYVILDIFSRYVARCTEMPPRLSLVAAVGVLISAVAHATPGSRSAQPAGSPAPCATGACYFTPDDSAALGPGVEAWFLAFTPLWSQVDGLVGLELGLGPQSRDAAAQLYWDWSQPCLLSPSYAGDLRLWTKIAGYAPAVTYVDGSTCNVGTKQVVQPITAAEDAAELCSDLVPDGDCTANAVVRRADGTRTDVWVWWTNAAVNTHEVVRYLASDAGRPLDDSDFAVPPGTVLLYSKDDMPKIQCLQCGHYEITLDPLPPKPPAPPAPGCAVSGAGGYEWAGLTLLLLRCGAPRRRRSPAPASSLRGGRSGVGTPVGAWPFC